MPWQTQGAAAWSNNSFVPCRNAQALRDFARNWLPLLFNAFMVASGQERPRYAAAIAAYSMLTDATVLSHFFREVVKKLLKVRLLQGSSCSSACMVPGTAQAHVVLRRLQTLSSHHAPLSWHSTRSSCGVASAESCSHLCLLSCSADLLAWQAAPCACVCTLLSSRSLLLVQVTADAAADLPPPDALKEGGDSASQRKCTFMELALCLAPGLNVAGIEILCKAIKPALQVGSRLPVTVIGGALPRSLRSCVLSTNLSPVGLACPAQERQ